MNNGSWIDSLDFFQLSILFLILKLHESGFDLEDAVSLAEQATQNFIDSFSDEV